MITISDFGLRIGVEGERDFKNALREINQSVKVLGSEMNLISSEFDKNDRSIQAVTARNTVLNKEIDAQKEKINTLEKALSNASVSFGENDKRTQAWVIQLNNAKAELSGMERELAKATDGADELGDELKESADEAENSGNKFEKLSGILKGVGATMGAVVVAATAAAFNLGKEVVQQFGELEQNLGGSEAVFGEYAASIQKSGEEAYKNLGLSQSEYLATANKMGALFQGSGIEQQKSLELTEKAMQRAADMASVMGIDMQMAMESVAGAAKGNFTMMDNLGVAMNATSVQAYAAAKGLDFVWASASQAEKSEVAMQMFFENTEQYAGNFAKESTETISGSFGLLQAALGSFTAGLGNANADMTNLTENLVDAFQSVVKNVVPVLENIVAALPAAFDAIITAISDLLPLLLDTVTNLFTQVLDTVMSLLPTLIPAAVDAVMTIVEALIDNLPLLIEAAVELVIALATGLGEALPELVPTIIEAILYIVETLVNNLDSLLDASLAIIMGLAEGLIAALPVLIEALPRIITAIIDFIANNIPQIIAMGVELVVQLAVGMVKAIPQLVAQIPKIIAAIIKGIIDCLGSIAEAGMSIMRSLWDGIFSLASWIKEKIGNLIDSIIGIFTGRKAEIEVEIKPVVTDNTSIQVAAQEEVQIERDKSKQIVEISKDTAAKVSETKSSSATAAKDAAQEEISLLKWQRDMELITEQDYYTGLERIRDTYYEEDSDKWRQHTLELKKLRDNDAKEAARLAESLAKDEEKAAAELAKEKERIAKENADAINRLGNDLTKALKSQYDEQKTALIQALDDEVDAVKSASYERIRRYDMEFAEKMRLLDDEESYRLGAIQAEIDAIDERTRAEDKARKQQDYEEKLSELKSKFSQATTSKEQQDIQKEVNRLVESRRREVTLEQRNAQKELLKQQLADEKQRIKEAKDALEQAKLEELEIQKDSIKTRFEELISGESLQAEALKLMLSEQQEDMLSLLETYYPEWKDTGKTFAEMLGAGVTEGKEKVERGLADILSRAINNQNSAGQSGQYAEAGQRTNPANNNFGFRSGNFENDFRLCMNGIQSTLDNMVQMIRPLARDIFSVFESPLKDEFAGLGSKLDSVIAAIDNIASTVSEPRIVITNTFNGVTAADVPHMVDRENTALLRRLRPGTM